MVVKDTIRIKHTPKGHVSSISNNYSPDGIEESIYVLRVEYERYVQYKWYTSSTCTTLIKGT